MVIPNSTSFFSLIEDIFIFYNSLFVSFLSCSTAELKMKIKEKEFESVLQDLKSLANQMGASVRFERGDFKGGYCILKENKVIVINKLATTQRKVMTLASALNELGVDSVYLPPKLRELIEDSEEEAK